MFVFDVSQTDGPPLEEPPSLRSQLASDAAFAFGYKRLREVALALDGAPVESIDVRARASGDPPSAAGWYARATRSIVVVENGNPAEMFRTMAHEVAHAILHGAGEHHDTATKELETESVAFIVCHAVGLDASGSSFPYVTHWAGSKDAAQAVIACGDRITKTANRILAALHPGKESSAEAAA